MSSANSDKIVAERTNDTIYTERHKMRCIRQFYPHEDAIHTFANACLYKFRELPKNIDEFHQQPNIDKVYLIGEFRYLRGKYRTEREINHLGAIYALCAVYEGLFDCKLGEDVRGVVGE